MTFKTRLGLPTAFFFALVNSVTESNPYTPPNEIEAESDDQTVSALGDAREEMTRLERLIGNIVVSAMIGSLYVAVAALFVHGGWVGAVAVAVFLPIVVGITIYLMVSLRALRR